MQRKKKWIKLSEWYCKSTDAFTIKADRCPLKRQNYDYAMCLLTVLYHESWKMGQWEKSKTEADVNMSVWENMSESMALPRQASYVATLLQIRPTDTGLHTQKELLDSPAVSKHRQCIIMSLKSQGDKWVGPLTVQGISEETLEFDELCQEIAIIIHFL